MNEIAEDQTIARLTPIIRIHKRCVTAIDDSGILQGRLGRSRRLTEAMCQPDGRAALQAGLSRVRRVNWNQIKSIVIAAPTAAPFLSGFWRITARHSQGRMEIKIPPHDAGHVLAAFEHFAMEKCQRRSGLRGHVTIGGITLFLVALLAGPPLLGALLGYLLGDSEAGFAIGLIMLVPVLLCFSAIMAMRLTGKKTGNASSAKAVAKPVRRKDLSGRKPLTSRKAGWVVKIASIAYMLGIVIFVNAPEDWGLRGQMYFYDLVMWLPGFIGLYIGYRLSLVSPPQLEEDESNRPFLYLRAFDDDNRTVMGPRGLTARLLGASPEASVMNRFNLVRLLRLIANRGADTSEEILASHFSKHGLFVAIGRPGEPLRSPGAHRIYVRDHEWQDKVLDYLARCRGVVLQPAKTDGIWWEVAQVLRRVEPQRILMSMVNFLNRPDDYESFRLRIEPLLGQPLPRHLPFLGEDSFIYFERDRTPRLQLLSYTSPWRWIIDCSPCDLEHTLDSYMRGIEGGDRPDPKPARRHPVQQVAAVLAIFGLNAGILLLIFSAILMEPRDPGHRLQRAIVKASPESITGRAVAYTFDLRGPWVERTQLPSDRLFVMMDEATNQEVARLDIRVLHGIQDARLSLANELAAVRLQEPFADARVDKDSTILVGDREWHVWHITMVEPPASAVPVLVRQRWLQTEDEILSVAITMATADPNFGVLVDELLDSFRLPPLE